LTRETIDLEKLARTVVDELRAAHPTRDITLAARGELITCVNTDIARAVTIPQLSTLLQMILDSKQGTSQPRTP
jgi:hypothetical protein